MSADTFVETASQKIDALKEEWLRFHLRFHVSTDRLGRIHRSQLAGFNIVEQQIDGWTVLRLMDSSREIAKARYRWDITSPTLELQWEALE